MANPPRILGLYIAEDGLIWAEDKALNRAYRMIPGSGPSTNYPSGPAQPMESLPPVDGNQYALKNQAWSQIAFPKPPIATDAPTDGQMYVRQNGLWVPRPKTTVQVITTPGPYSWSPPVGAVMVRVIGVGAGNGGGSGRVSAVGTAAAGGLGGAGGSWSMGDFTVSQLLPVTYGFVGFGMIGGLAVSAANTNGNSSTLNPAGNCHTIFGAPSVTSNNSVTAALVAAYGGAGSGQGGLTTPFSSGGQTPGGDFPGQTAGGNSITANSTQPPAINGKGAGAGGNGGGINTAGTSAYNGAAGGQGGTGYHQDQNYGAAGIVPGGNGGNGGNQGIIAGTYPYLPGTGGGGGGGSITGNGGNGGNGSIYGGGGGGGGAALNGFSSGAGGNGANGLMIIIVFF